MPIDWTATPPKNGHQTHLELVRVPAKLMLAGFITTNDLLGCLTHWNGRRTVPCQGLDCDDETHKRPTRWHAYTGLWIDKTNEHVILELPSGAAEKLQAAKNGRPSIRGLQIQCFRPKHEAHAAVTVRLIDSPAIPKNLPEEPDLRTMLTSMWGNS